MRSLNVSKFSDELTACTSSVAARQRAFELSHRSVSSVIELCVGPSFSGLKQAYNEHGIIDVFANDIDKRWQLASSSSRWIVGDALQIEWPNVDCVVFAPPLSKGCSGKRDDALSIDEVEPKFDEFIDRWTQWEFARLCVLVLPGRSLSTRSDRSQFHRLCAKISTLGFNVDHIVSYCKKQKIAKYHELFVSKNER